MSISYVRTRCIILLIVIPFVHFFSINDTWAQKIDRKFNHITVDDGLSNNSGWFSYQDSRGYMWFGTYAGLNRYDGTNMKIYVPDTNDSTTISDLWVESCVEDSVGNLWLGTFHGLNKYDYKTDRFTQYFNNEKLNSLPNNDINDLLISKKGELWIATMNGLARYNYTTDDFEHFLYHDILAGKNFLIHEYIISSMAEDEEGNLILATGAGSIIIFNTESYEYEEIKYIDKEVETADWAKLVLDSTNVIWISCYNNGLFSMDYLTKEVTNYSIPGNKLYLNNLVARSIFIDSNFNLWLGSDGDGLFIINPERTSFQNYRANAVIPTALSTNRGIFDIFEDRNGIVWVSQYYSGISYYDPNEKDFNTIRNDPTNPKSLALNEILDFHEDKEGIIWIGMDGGGLDEYYPLSNEFKHNVHLPSNKNSLQSNVIKSIDEDMKGNLIVGTWNSGLLIFNKSTKTSKQYAHDVNDPNSLVQNDIWAIEVDQQGKIWLGTLQGGLDRFIPEKGIFKHYGPFSENLNKTNDSDIRAMYQGIDGIIWIGTISGGVNKLNPETEKIDYLVNDPKDENSLAKNDVRAILKDADGIMWFGTNGAGLDRYDEAKNTFKHYTMEDGLPSNIIQGILQDDEGSIWIATGKGLATLDYQTNKFKSYFKNDGLQGDDFQYGASMKAKDGTLYFGGVNGFNAFQPSKIKDHLQVPNIVFTKLSILYNEASHKSPNSVLKFPIEETESITLNYNQTEFSIEFAALNYTNPEKNQFAYKMEGFDKDWIFIGNKKIASYTNLDPGEYIFRVKTSINDGIWSEKGRSLSIHILPPWWETWWAYSLLAGIILCSMYLLIKFRTSYIENQRALLQKLVNKRTIELKEKNDRIEMQAKELTVFNQSLNEVNDNLEKKVDQRTIELTLKNAKLAEYAFINAHNLRVPVANIKGIIQLFEGKRPQEEIDELIKLLKGQSNNLDNVLIEIQDMLEKDTNFHKGEDY
ncbi:MAG: hypothetical protein OCD76_20300 [Reichenbachiella sp.]